VYLFLDLSLVPCVLIHYERHGSFQGNVIIFQYSLVYGVFDDISYGILRPVVSPAGAPAWFNAQGRQFLGYLEEPRAFESALKHHPDQSGLILIYLQFFILSNIPKRHMAT